jgi:hypothetical protein
MVCLGQEKMFLKEGKKIDMQSFCSRGENKQWRNLSFVKEREDFNNMQLSKCF